MKKETFKALIDNKDYFGAFMGVLQDSMELEVKTVIEKEIGAGSTMGIPQETGVMSELAQQREYGNRLLTQINLLDGDIKNMIGREFLADEYKDVLEFHRKQVLEGQTIIQNNLIALQNVIEAIQKFSEQNIRNLPR